MQQIGVVFQQPIAMPAPSVGEYGIPVVMPNSREWSTGLFGCFEDCCTCAYAYFCYPCFMASLAGELGECALGPCFVGNMFIVPMRTKIRTMHGIRGSILSDVCTATCCGFCSSLQMYHELKHLGQLQLRAMA